MSIIFRKLKVEKATRAHLVCMNTLEKHIVMLSLFDPYKRRREICIRLLIILEELINLIYVRGIHEIFPTNLLLQSKYWDSQD